MVLALQPVARLASLVLRQITKGEPVDWADLALAGGYCDQAHLINEFRGFSGISPSAYLASGQS
jgi:AraC-like DNA-binding protein